MDRRKIPVWNGELGGPVMVAWRWVRLSEGVKEIYLEPKKILK